MYGMNALRHNWWDEVEVIVWGATVALVTENLAIQALIQEAKEVGVRVSVCKSCAQELGVAQKIDALGLEMMFWGEPLSNLLKENQKLITI